MKFEKGYFGGNMEALEANYKGYQILINDGNGGTPEENGPYSMGIYAYDKESGEFDYEPVKSFEGKRLNTMKAAEKAMKYIDSKRS